MTNHKCGTCRFYEVGAQQTHGWCRNPAYPRRDDVALLRNDELACRSGWGKDFWAARDADASIPESTSPLIDETTQPIPVPIGTGITEHRLPTLVAALRTPAAMGVPPRQDGAHAATDTASAAVRTLANAPKDGMMGTIKATPTLNGHPELNELGVPIRAPKRSSVAEAHRRAMERRAQERQAKEERDRLAAQEALKQADALREQQAQLTITESPLEQRPILGELHDRNAPALALNRPTADDASKGERLSPKRELLRAESNVPKRELARPAITAPIMPRPREADLAVETMSRDEAEDVIISTGEAVKETIKTPAIDPPFVPETPTPQEGAVGFRTFEATTEPEVKGPQASAAANLPTPEPPPPAKEARPAPYWDQPGAFKGFERLRSEGNRATLPDRANDGPVRQVGRPATDEPKPMSARSIKPMGGSTGTAGAVEEEREIAPPVRPAKPVEVKQAIVAPPPAPVEPAPRQIDESLLRQLENDWQAQQRAAHAGQRCGTCRFFQPTELGRGLCNCAFAPVHRQQTEAEGLPCATALGIWWAAPDEGWLERTERRPRRATPLLDALLREREAMEPLRTAPPLRRGAR